jgi:cytidine deaminase
MKKINITSSFNVYTNLGELPIEIQNLFKKAIEVRDSAYAPYSNFLVGCAILLENNKIITGNNQENAAYPSGICAERVAIWSASSQYPNIKIKKLIVTGRSQNKKLNKPVAPCGACRQAIAEYEINQLDFIEIYFMGETGEIIKANSLKDLLPLGFDKSFL